MEIEIRSEGAEPGAEFGSVTLAGLAGAEDWMITVGLRGLASGLVRPAALTIRPATASSRLLTGPRFFRLPFSTAFALAVTARVLGVDSAKSVDLAVTRPRGGSRRFTEAVAALHRAASAAGIHGAQMIQSAWDCSERTAYNWINEAEEIGLTIRETSSRAATRSPCEFPAPDLTETKPSALPDIPSRQTTVTSSAFIYEDFPGWREWQVQIPVFSNGARDRVGGLTIQPSPYHAQGPAQLLSARLLRDLPVHQFIKLAVGSGWDSQVSMNVLTALDVLPAHHRGDAHLHAVAAAYRTAVHLGVPPRRVIAHYWDVELNGQTLRRWIARAHVKAILGTYRTERDRRRDKFQDHGEDHYRGRCPCGRRARFKDDAEHEAAVRAGVISPRAPWQKTGEAR
ncbi:hypothetical protein [Kitasatospora purpeofusca]|uniref:hypothetical protein n=1 Tax=Kitasatospora purpeofusca TaxID=67352 RepID=UPI0038295C7C